MIVSLYVSSNSLAETDYYDTVWPTEHADSARHQFVDQIFGINFFDPLGNRVRLNLRGNNTLDFPMFTLTRDTNEVYSIGGSPSLLVASGWIAKIDPDTLSVQRLTHLTKGRKTWTPSAAIHTNGYIYVVSSHYLYKLDSQLNIVKFLSLPDVAEGESNLLVLSDGTLIVKGGLVDVRKKPKSTILLVNPHDLTIIYKLTLPEVSRGRFSLYSHNGNQYVYSIGVTTVWRALYNPGTLTLDSTWSFDYISKLADSSWGNAPTFLGNDLFMMNNSEPDQRYVVTDPIYIIRVNLDDASNYKIFQPFPGTTNGYSLSKMPADPSSNIVFPLDTNNGKFGAFRYLPSIDEFQQLWVKDLNVSGIFAGSSVSGHIYVNGFNATTSIDDFIVLDILTGEELDRINTPNQSETYSQFAIGFRNRVYYNGGGIVCKIWAWDQ